MWLVREKVKLPLLPPSLSSRGPFLTMMMMISWLNDDDGRGMLRGPIQVDLATSYIERSIPGGGFVIGFTAHSTMLHKWKPKHLTTPSYYYITTCSCTWSGYIGGFLLCVWLIYGVQSSWSVILCQTHKHTSQVTTTVLPYDDDDDDHHDHHDDGHHYLPHTKTSQVISPHFAKS